MNTNRIDQPVISASNNMTSVVLPAHNESAGIENALSVISNVLVECGHDWEIIVVDDGSSDGMFDVVCDIARREPHIRCIRFSRNFGKESALLAGLRHANGQRVITLDADLQHPPELIPKMLQEWENGALIVNAVKESRESDTRVARIRARIFNGVLSWLGGIQIQDSSDFKLLDRQVVNALSEQLPERTRFYRGLTDWLGFPSVDVPFEVSEREQGTGKWSVLNLIDLAVTALVSFTSAPLRIVSILGFLTLILGTVIGIDALASWARGDAVSGFASIIMTLLLIGSFVMISLGVIGEYIAKIYTEVKSRPSYLISESTDDICERDSSL